MKSLKKTLSLVLVMAMLAAMVVPAQAETVATNTDVTYTWTGVECSGGKAYGMTIPWSNGATGIEFTVELTTGSSVVGGSQTFNVSYDADVLAPAAAVAGAPVTAAGASDAVSIPIGSAWTIDRGEQAGNTLVITLAAPEDTSYTTPTVVAYVYFAFASGKGIGDLNSNSVRLSTELNELKTSGTNSALSLNIGSGANNKSYVYKGCDNYFSQYVESEYELTSDAFDITYPRSTATGAVTLKTGGNTKLTLDGPTIKTAAPEKGKTYTAAVNAAGVLAVLEADTTKLGTGETVTGIEKKTQSSTTNTYSVVEDNGVYSLTSGVIAYEAAPSTVTVTISVNGPKTSAEGVEPATYAYTYTADATVTIPAVILPENKLDATAEPPENAGTYVFADGAHISLATAMTGKLPDGWTIMTDTDAAKLTDSYTVKTAEELAADVTEQVYTIPVFFATDNTDYRDSGDIYTLTVTKAPSATSVASLATNVTKGTYSLKFNDATNTAWQYALSEHSTGDTITTLAVPLNKWADGATGGIEFGGLHEGTDYYLHVRVKDEDNTQVDAATAIATLYDISVKSAQSNGQDALKTDTTDNSKYVSIATTDVVADQNELDAYKQTIVLKNTNGNSVYDVSITLTELSAAGNFTIEDGDITYGGTSSQAEWKAGDEITVVVTPQKDACVKGENTAKLTVTGKSSNAVDATVDVSKKVPLKLIMMGGRGNGTQAGNEDLVLLASNTAVSDADATTMGITKAKANTEITLDFTWMDGATTLHADDYKVSDTTNYTITGDKANGFKLKIVNDRTLDDKGGDGITVTGIFNASNAGEAPYYVRETMEKTIVIKGAALDLVGATAADATASDVEITIGAEAPANSKDMTYGVTGVTAAAKGNVTAGTSIDSNYKVTVADGATPGVTIYTVTVPSGNGDYVASTADVNVYALSEMTDIALDDAELDYNATAGSTSNINLKVEKNGTTYAAGKYEILPEGGTASEIQKTDVAGDGTYAMPVTTAGKFTITVTIPASKTGTYSSAFVATKDVYVRKTVAWSGDEAYVLDYDKKPTPETEGTFNLTTGETGEQLSYEILDGATIITLGEDAEGHKTFTATGTAFGVAKVKVTSAEINTQKPDSKIVTIEVKHNAAPGGDPDPGAPVHGTGANILGNVNGSYVPFNAKSEGATENDHWGDDGASDVKFTNLTKGVKYAFRVALTSDKTKWYVSTGTATAGDRPPVDSDADGWRVIPDADITNTGEFVWVPLGEIYTAEIRYVDDGTVGPTVVDKDPVDFTIHNLTIGVKYEFRVKTGDNTYDTTITGADENGWVPVPAYAEDNENTVKQTVETLYMYKHAYTGTYVAIETRYANKPDIKKVGDDYVISGLVPNAAYELLEVGKDYDDDAADIVERKADATGTITIVHDTADFTKLNITEHNGVQVRKKAGPGENPEPPVTPKTGVTVKGQVKSYMRCVETNLYLFKWADESTAPVWKTGRVLGTYDYTTKIEAMDPTETGAHASSQATQDFAFSTIPEGKYTLVAVKKGCTYYAIEGVVVGGSEVDLTKSSKADVKLITLNVGDGNNDGIINALDMGAMTQSTTWKKVDTVAANYWCDFNGDGIINALDMGIMTQTTNWKKVDVTTTFG